MDVGLLSTLDAKVCSWRGIPGSLVGFVSMVKFFALSGDDLRVPIIRLFLLPVAAGASVRFCAVLAVRIGAASAGIGGKPTGRICCTLLLC